MLKKLPKKLWARSWGRIWAGSGLSWAVRGGQQRAQRLCGGSQGRLRSSRAPCCPPCVLPYSIPPAAASILKQSKPIFAFFLPGLALRLFLPIFHLILFHIHFRTPTRMNSKLYSKDLKEANLFFETEDYLRAIESYKKVLNIFSKFSIQSMKQRCKLLVLYQVKYPS